MPCSSVTCLDTIACQIKKNGNQMRAFKLMVTIDRITGPCFKVDDTADHVRVSLRVCLLPPRFHSSNRDIVIDQSS